MAYFNLDTGRLQIDPRGLDISLFNITYTTGTTNVGSTSPGPFRYPDITPLTDAVSLATGVTNQRTFPAGTWTSLTAWAARVAGTVSLTGSPTLATTYDAGNGASTSGWFNTPWSFPYANDPAGTAGLVDPTAIAGMTINNFKVFGVSSSHANVNLLGFGTNQGVFSYFVNGITGNQVGPVIPVRLQSPPPPPAVPEPSTLALGFAGLIGLCGYRARARRQRGAASA